MLVGHLIPLCFNFPNYKISIFTSLNYSGYKLLDWLTLSCLWGKGVWHTWSLTYSVKYWRLGDKQHAFKTRKLTVALNCSIVSTTFILLYKLLLLLTDKLLRSQSAHFLDQNPSFLSIWKETYQTTNTAVTSRPSISTIRYLWIHKFLFFHSLTAMPKKSRCLQGWAGIAVPLPATTLVLRKQNQTLGITQAGRKVIRPVQEEQT